MNHAVILDESHTYRVDGEWKPGVTEILHHFGMLQFGAPGSELEHTEAMQLGTAVHAAVEYHEKGILNQDSLHDRVRPRFEAYLKFKADTGFVARVVEEALYHPGYKYCGKLDLEGTDKDKNAVLPDIKTGGWQDGYALQIAAYDLLLPPTKKPRKRFGLELKADGSYKIHPCNDRNDHALFLSLVSAFWWKFNHGYIKPKN